MRTREFYERHGGKTIILARFIPIIRTFAPVVAGVGRMDYRRFLAFNVLGGIGWVCGLTWAGYLLGQTIPDIGRYIHVVIVVVIVLSLILSAAMLLAWYGRRNKAKPFEAAAAAIEKSVEAAIAAKESTADIGGRSGTNETGDAVVARVHG